MTVHTPLEVILIQDLTYVNGEVLALYVGNYKNFYIERWLDRVDGWDSFLFLKIEKTTFLGYLEGKISLYNLTQHCLKWKFFIKLYKGGQTNNSIAMPSIPVEYLPKKDSFLENRTDFLEDRKFHIVCQICYSGGNFSNLQNIFKNYNLGPIQTLELPNFP